MADNAHGVLLMAVASGDSVLLRSSDDGRTLTKALTGSASGGIPWADLGFTTASQAVVVLAPSNPVLQPRRRTDLGGRQVLTAQAGPGSVDQLGCRYQGGQAFVFIDL